MSKVDKNIKCTAEELKEFDDLMRSEKQLPKSRHEFLVKLMTAYQKQETVKEVPVIKEKIVYKTKNANKKTINKMIAALDWLDKNTLYIPSSKNREVVKMRNEIRECVNSL